MAKTIQRTKTIYACNHCGLEIDSPRPTECPQCARTFFLPRQVMTDEYWDEQRQLDITRRATEAQERAERRRRLARDIRTLLKTGWYGYQIIPEGQRREKARTLLAESR